MDKRENWKPVPAINGKYEISDLGRVRNTATGYVIKTAKHAQGYRLVQLYRGGGQKVLQRSLHSLVMEVFVGPRPEGMVVCHNNGDPTCNTLENLRYDTQRNNMLEAYSKHGVVSKIIGVDHPFAILDNDKVYAIRYRLSRSESIDRLANAYGVSRGAITNIKYNRTWKHL